MPIQCVNSIRQTCDIPYKIYLVDNNSTIKMPVKFFDFMNEKNDIEYIRADENRGYSAGNNLGIFRALQESCNYILISNDDVIFQKESISELHEFLKNHTEYGIAGPKVFLPNGALQEINMGCKLTLSGKYKYLLRKTPFRFLVEDFVGMFHAYDKDISQPFQVYAVSGCCFMMSNHAATMLYPLDENTFMYEEENIIGIKMEHLGLKTIYDTRSHIVHIGGATSKSIPARSYRYFIESECYYCRKYLNASVLELSMLELCRIIVYIKKYGFSGLPSLLYSLGGKLFQKF